MRNIWALTAANLRKNKSQTFTLLVFVLAAAMLLNIGLVITLRTGSFFDEQAEDNHAAHFTGIYNAIDSANSIEQGQRFLETNPDVSEIEMLSALGGWGNYYLSGLEMSGLLILSRADNNQNMDPPTLIGDSLPLIGDAVYIPYTLMLNGGYGLGDKIEFKLAGTLLSFTVAGATEEIMFGSQTYPFFRIYLSDENWDAINARFPQNALSLLSARLNPGKNSTVFLTDYNTSVSNAGLLWETSYDIAKSGRITFTMIMAAMIVAFSIVLLAVCLIVIRFRIVNSVEESMLNIGVQKAVGYRNVQIISSIALQFALIAFFGGVMGMAVSQAAIPVIMGVLKPMLGFIWNPGFDAATAGISIAAVLLTALMVSWVSAGGIGRLHPLTALRGGVSACSFNKNHFPLDKSSGPLNLLLALKQVAQNKKRTFGISLIVAAVTAASVVGLVLTYNISGDRQIVFARSIFGEIPCIDVLVMLNNDVDGAAYKERMTNRSDVRKIFGYTGNSPMSFGVDGTDVSMIAAEDCSLMEGNTLIDGRYPKHENEIALSFLAQRTIGKSIGDTVTVRNGEKKSEYLITGTVQSTEGNGINGLITGEGLRLLIPEFEFLDYAVYLNENTAPKMFIESIQETEGDIFDVIVDEQQQVNNLIKSVAGIFVAVSVGIGAATLFVIILALYMALKTTILRRRRELGIQKALGFTTLQLMNQIALNMSPIILLGAILGAVAGSFAATPMVVAMFSGMGISELQLAIPIWQTVVLSLALVILAYIVSMLIAWRIRKISAYALVTE